MGGFAEVKQRRGQQRPAEHDGEKIEQEFWQGRNLPGLAACMEAILAHPTRSQMTKNQIHEWHERLEDGRKQYIRAY